MASGRRALGIVRAVAAAAAVALFLVLAAPAAALEQKLTAADGKMFDFFGSSVAIDGDTAVVGAPAANEYRGAVYVFTRSGDSWTQTAKLTVQATSWDDTRGVGASVAIDGDTIVAGAPAYSVFGGPADKGAVYTFARTGASDRNQTAVLLAPGGAANDRLGSSVAIDGDTIVAGAPNNDSVGASTGAVYTFARTGAATRHPTAKLTAAGGSVAFLGESVAIDGDTIVAGAPRDDIAADASQGSVYAFARTGSAQRGPVAKLTVADGATQDRLGSSVAIEGDVIVAGAPFDDVDGHTNRGSAYTFARTGAATRSEIARLSASDGAADDWLGVSVALDGEVIVVGAPLDDVDANDFQGSVYAFARPGTSRTQVAKLIATDGGTNDEFGSSVAIDAGQVIAGARHDSVGTNTFQGSASIFFAPAAVPPVVPVVPPVVTPVVPPVVPLPRASPPRPSVTAFDFAPNKIAVARKATAIAAVARGGRFKYTLNTPVRVTIVIERKLRGRRQGRRCVSPKKRLKRTCTRYKRSGTLTRIGKTGKNTIAFSGRIGSRALARGSYRATIKATNATGASARRTTSFKVVRAAKRRARR